MHACSEEENCLEGYQENPPVVRSVLCVDSNRAQCAAFSITQGKALPNDACARPDHDDAPQPWMDKAKGLPNHAEGTELSNPSEPLASTEPGSKRGHSAATSSKPIPPASTEHYGRSKSTWLIASTATTHMPASSASEQPFSLSMETPPLKPQGRSEEKAQAPAPPNSPSSAETEVAVGAPPQKQQHFALHPLFPHLPADTPLTYTLTMQACLCEEPYDRPSFANVATLLQDMQDEISTGQYLNSDGVLRVRCCCVVPLRFYSQIWSLYLNWMAACLLL